MLDRSVILKVIHVIQRVKVKKCSGLLIQAMPVGHNAHLGRRRLFL